MTDTPRQRRRIKNTAAILDAAAELIIAKGFENVSLRDIARQADYSPSGLYKYFDSKADIIQALKTQENQKLLSLLETAPTDIPAKQRLIDLCMLYIEHCLKNRVYLTLVNSLSSERKSMDQPVTENSPYQVFLQAVQAWNQSEGIPSQQGYGLEEITYALWSQIHGMATLRLFQLRDFEADFDTVNRRTLEIFLKGLCECVLPVKKQLTGEKP
jgi:AcrR family transcriptional regulator